MRLPPIDEPLGADVLEAEEADRDGTATPEQLELLDRSEVKAATRRMYADVRPVVQRAKRDLLNRPEQIDRRRRRDVVPDFVRPRCEARPHYARRQSRDRPVRRRGSRRATAPTRGDPEDPEPPGRSLVPPRSRRRQHKGGRS
jgi:hypothetical protein